MDFGNFEEAVTVVANPLKLRKDLFMETSAALKQVKTLLMPEIKRVRSRWNY